MQAETERLSQIVEFCKVIDKEKFIQRHTYLTGGERFENDAEHAWHMAVMALLLSDYANEKVDVLKVVSILLIHDLVEVYAGDTFAYDEEGKKSQREREVAAADRLYVQLPEDLGKKLRSLWDEFEAGETPEAKFAHTLDNFQPMMLQSATHGKAWREGGRRLSEVLRRNENSAAGSTALWEYARANFIQPEIDAGNLTDDCTDKAFGKA
jgi:putative hydrolases of HD superfamily